MNYGVGIDLGTTRCCVAIQDNNGHMKIVPNDMGKNTTPSCVFFGETSVLVGESALSAPRVGKNLIYDAKRIIGRQYEDAAVTKDRRLWSFDVVRESKPPDDGKAMIKIEENGQSRLVAPEEVSAELLKKLKAYAISFYGGDDINSAVIAHPAYFDTKQKRETEKAAKLAGFENVKLISEPTAAAVAFGMKTLHENKTILIYDLGGGTFDVSIGKIVNEQLDILAVHGLPHLGGEDFDTAIVDDFTKSFEEAHGILFPIEDSTQIRRLRNEARVAKENMSGMILPQTIEMSVTINGKSYQHTYKIDRKRFNELCNNYFESTMGVVDETLAKANLNISQINDVLMVGGSTRIPQIKELVRAKFPKANIMNNINPDEAVAIGAAILASQMDPNKPLPNEPLPSRNDIPNIGKQRTYAASHMELDIREAVPLSIGMELRGGIVKVVIPRGTTYPCEPQRLETVTVVDNQQRFEADIYEGERARTSDNTKIGSIVMENLSPQPRGSPHTTTFEIDGNGILKVTHTEERSKRTVEFTYKYDGPRKTTADIAHFMEEAMENREADDLLQKVCAQRRVFDTYVYNESQRIEKLELAPSTRKACQNIIEKYKCWLDEFPEDIDEIQMKFTKFKESLRAIIGSYDVNEVQQKFGDSLKIDQTNSSNSEEKILFHLSYDSHNINEGRICLFDSHNYSVEQIAKFTNYLRSYEVATTKDKIFAIESYKKSFEIFDLNTRKISRGPAPPEWRKWGSVAYFKNKLYYLGGDANRVDVLIDGKWQTGPAFPLPIKYAQTITCDEILYVIDGCESRKMYRLSGDEREWIEIKEIPEKRIFFGVASLNGKLYITGGSNGKVLKFCLYFDPLAPVDSRISPIADMNYGRKHHSLIVANRKLYVIGGRSCDYSGLCTAIEEYDPVLNEWKVVSHFLIKIEELVAIVHEANKLGSFTENENAQNADKVTRTVVNACEAAVRNVNSLIINLSNANYIIRKNDSEISIQQREEYLKPVNKFSDIANELKSLATMAEQYAESGVSIDKIEKLQRSMSEMMKKLAEAKDATPMFNNGNEMQQAINNNRLFDSNVEEGDKFEEPEESDAEKLQNIQPMQPPDFNSMKFAFLTSLSECVTSSRLPHGLAEDLLYYVFFLCMDCRKYSSSVIDQFTASEKEQLKKDLLIAILRLESNLKGTFDNPGTGKVADLCRVRSGLQFLQDEIVSQLYNLDLNTKMFILLQSEFVKEINNRLTSWKGTCEWDSDEHLDLQFIPVSHDWYLKEQRYEIIASGIMSPKTEMVAAKEKLMEETKKQHEKKMNAAKESLKKLEARLANQEQNGASEAEIRETKPKIAEQHETIEKLWLDFIGVNRWQLDAYHKDLEQCTRQIENARAVDNKRVVELENDKAPCQEDIEQYTRETEESQKQFLDNKGAAMKDEGAKEEYLKFVENAQKNLGKNTLIEQNGRIIRAVTSMDAERVFYLVAKTESTVCFSDEEDIILHFNEKFRVHPSALEQMDKVPTGQAKMDPKQAKMDQKQAKMDQKQAKMDQKQAKMDQKQAKTDLERVLKLTAVFKDIPIINYLVQIKNLLNRKDGYRFISDTEINELVKELENDFFTRLTDEQKKYFCHLNPEEAYRLRTVVEDIDHKFNIERMQDMVTNAETIKATAENILNKQIAVIEIVKTDVNMKQLVKTDVNMKQLSEIQTTTEQVKKIQTGAIPTAEKQIADMKVATEQATEIQTEVTQAMEVRPAAMLAAVKLAEERHVEDHLREIANCIEIIKIHANAKVKEAETKAKQQKPPEKLTKARENEIRTQAYNDLSSENSTEMQNLNTKIDERIRIINSYPEGTKKYDSDLSAYYHTEKHGESTFQAYYKKLGKPIPENPMPEQIYEIYHQKMPEEIIDKKYLQFDQIAQYGQTKSNIYNMDVPYRDDFGKNVQRIYFGVTHSERIPIQDNWNYQNEPWSSDAKIASHY